MAVSSLEFSTSSEFNGFPRSQSVAKKVSQAWNQVEHVEDVLVKQSLVSSEISFRAKLSLSESTKTARVLLQSVHAVPGFALGSYQVAPLSILGKHQNSIK